MVRIFQKTVFFIFVIFLVSACLSDPDDPDSSSGSTPSPLTALATLKVVDDNVSPVLDYNLQILSGTVDQQFTDGSGMAVITGALNGDTSMENHQGFGTSYMDTFVYFTLTDDTDFTANPIMAPWSNGLLPDGTPDNWCYNDLDPTATSTGGFLRVYKSSDAAVFLDSDSLSVTVTVFNVLDDSFFSEFLVDSENDLATVATEGLPYIDIWNAVGAVDVSGQKNTDVTGYDYSDPDKSAQAEVNLNGVLHTVEFAPCGAFGGGILSIVYF